MRPGEDPASPSRTSRRSFAPWLAGAGATAVVLGVVRQDRLFAVALVAGIISLVVSHRRSARAQERRAVLWALHAPEGLMDGQMTELAISVQLAVIAAGDVRLLEGAASHLSGTVDDPWRRSLARERVDAAIQLTAATPAPPPGKRAARVATLALLGIVGFAALTQGQLSSLATSFAVAALASMLTRRDQRRLTLELVREKATTPVPGVPVTIPEAEIIDVLTAVAGWRSRILRRASVVASRSASPQRQRARRRLAAADQRLSSSSDAT